MAESENMDKPVELNDDALEAISGGDYGELLKPGGYYWATCSCGHREYIADHQRGKVVCPQCNLQITTYIAASCR